MVGSRPRVALAGLVVVAAAAAALLAGTFVSGAAAAPRRSAKKKVGVADVVTLTIVTDDQTGKKGWPAFVPNDITLPAHSTVEVRIVDFDDATAQKPAKYAKVYSTDRAWGVVGGTIAVQAMNPADPNKLGPAKTVKALDPKDDVGHTFTVAGLGLNVPVAPHAVTSFLLKTGKPGRYYWRCMNPCGTGPTGWGGPMTAGLGYMDGHITVV